MNVTHLLQAQVMTSRLLALDHALVWKCGLQCSGFVNVIKHINHKLERDALTQRSIVLVVLSCGSAGDYDCRLCKRHYKRNCRDTLLKLEQQPLSVSVTFPELKQ